MGTVFLVRISFACRFDLGPAALEDWLGSRPEVPAPAINGGHVVV
jgi:hypothetical protein